MAEGDLFSAGPMGRLDVWTFWIRLQEGGRVVWGEGLGAEGDEVGVVGGGEGGRRAWRRRGLVDRELRFAALCCVEDEDAVGEIVAQALRRRPFSKTPCLRVLRTGRPPRVVEVFDAGKAVFHITIQSNANLIAG